ncbi:hypothetical protein Trydic_g19951 [Trypoxylus dichotomus]
MEMCYDRKSKIILGKICLYMIMKHFPIIFVFREKLSTALQNIINCAAITRGRMLIFLWFIGHQTVLSVNRIIKRAFVFVSNLSPHIIKWLDGQEKLEIEQHFRFANTIGGIDGCHIKIDKPQTDTHSRKGHYSVQLQVIRNHRRKILDVFRDYPGSVHNNRVLRNSPRGNHLKNKFGQYYILADSDYALTKNILTPFKDRENLLWPTEAEVQTIILYQVKVQDENVALPIEIPHHEDNGNEEGDDCDINMNARANRDIIVNSLRM